MEALSKETVSLLQYLAPGFIAAWIYYGLTPNAKPPQFERVVQALIFTVIVQTLVLGQQSFFEFVGRYHSIGIWTSQVNLVASVATGLLLGALIAIIISKEWVHRCARFMGMSRGTGHPSDLYAAFVDEPRWVVLQLKSGMRLEGWPLRFPSQPDIGHVYLTHVGRTYKGFPCEDLEDLSVLHGMLIAVSDIESIEFLNLEKKNDSKTAAATATSFSTN